MANRARTLYNTSKRVRDELGKGQELLRKASATLRVDNVARTQWSTILVPDVGIRVVDISVISEVKLTGADANTLDVYKRYGGADVALITQYDPDTETAKTPSFKTLTADADSVAGGAQIMMRLVNGGVAAGSAAAPTDVTVEVSYILGDEERTY